MGFEKPTYRIKINNCGTPPDGQFGWEIYRNADILPFLRSHQFFISRSAGIADANRSRARIIAAEA
jgi:hypothetical protein